MRIYDVNKEEAWGLAEDHPGYSIAYPAVVSLPTVTCEIR